MPRTLKLNSTIKIILIGSALGTAYILPVCNELVEAQPSSGSPSAASTPETAVPTEVPGQLLAGDQPQIEPPPPKPDPLIARGRYLAVIAGCNDCHTAGFAQSGGSTPESEWLLGDGIGFRGPWGTTYPVNLRLYLNGLSEDQWLDVARKLKSRPPMPSYALNQMEEDDLRAIFRFVKSLGETGSVVPAYVGPGAEPKTPYIVFEPVSIKDKITRTETPGKPPKSKTDH